jgi:two-component system nitrogen regulation response regulator GlnG
VIRIELPPLRARKEDIPELLAHYLESAGRELGVEPKQLSVEARTKLLGYAWPGNIRELVNLCRRLSVLAPGSEIRAEDLPTQVDAERAAERDIESWTRALTAWADREASSDKPSLLERALPEFERVLIGAALKRTRGRRQDAAKLLGWGRNTLTRKLKELGLNDSADESV